MMTQTLAIRDLGVRRAGTDILSGVSCALTTGQVVGVIGPNGAGKSTLLSAVAGHTGFSGTVSWGGSGSGVQPKAGDIGYMPQSCKVSASLTVLETVLLGTHERLGWRVSQGDIARATGILAELSLSHLASRCMTTLSGGQQQLVLLAQRLVRQPRLLVLDEATSALDMSHQISVLMLLKRYVVRHNALALMAIHDLNIAMQYADQLVLIHDGRLVQQDAPESVLSVENIRRCYGLDVDLVARAGGRPVIAPLAQAMA
ncbi:ABC transporter ATP-binding protein [Thalassospira sp. HJ]|uniref:ABC transporter ATP-binding protein n=1 Tax=Thalassospira sp. HJ TaxID=1616823 RepID=UPI0019109B02|nr:ABC transporter ATP-binding protein [Thalassospira sp. HJ]